MKRFSSKLGLTAFLLAAFTLPALADDAPAGILGQRPGAGLRRVMRCLKVLDLSASQKSEIQAVLQGARPQIRPIREALKADREKLESDIASGADKAVIGQDVLDLRADAKKLREEIQSLKDQLLGNLTSDQKAKLQGCLEALRPNASATP